MSSIHFIHHLVLYNQVLMAVIADKKAGKSTFASLLQQTLSMHVDSTLIHAQALSKLTDLEAQLKAQKILAADETLDDFVARVNASKQPKLIIIDDAHYLNVATLTTLMRFLQHNPLKNFLHICLVGNPSLTHALKALNTLGYQDAIHSFKLGGLNERETKTYIVHHTARKSRHLNHEKIQQTLFLKSAGNLARINELLEQQDLLLKPKIPHLDTVFLSTFLVAIIEPFVLLCKAIISLEQFFLTIRSSANNIKKCVPFKYFLHFSTASPVPSGLFWYTNFIIF